MSGERSFVAALAIGLAAIGCGGNVVVDGPGGGGGGGGGGTPTGGTTTGGTTTSTVFNPVSYCSFLCSQADLNGCLEGGEVSECQDSCVELFGEFPACHEELKVFYDCVVAQFQVDCDSAPDVCSEELEGVAACFDPGP